MASSSTENLFSRWRILLAAGIIVIAALGAYHNSFSGPFIFDGEASIADNSHIRQLWPIWNIFPAELGSTVAGRSAGSGIASYYWQGQQTASGARLTPSAMTAAHRSLPFGTKVRVTNKRNGRSVVVTINDRGPFIRGRIIDLSRGAAQVIGMTGAGLAPVSLDVL